MSELETKLSFPQPVSSRQFGHFTDIVSSLSGCYLRLLRESSGDLLFLGEYVPFSICKLVGRKYLYGSLSYLTLQDESRNLGLKARLRGAVADYFLKSDGVLQIPFSRAMSESDVSVLFEDLKRTLDAEVYLDGKTRMLMNRGKLDVGGSIRKKPHVLAFKCEYRNGKCFEMKICVPYLSSLDLYEDVHGFVEGYSPPQRL